MKKNTFGKITALLVIAFGAWLGATCQNKQEKVNDMTQTKQTEKILFINGSPNRDGNTASLAQTLLEGKTYETLNLNDYRLNFYGQTLEGDELDKVVERMKAADIIVMGSPVYWHNICPQCVPLWSVSTATFQKIRSRANASSLSIKVPLPPK